MVLRLEAESEAWGTGDGISVGAVRREREREKGNLREASKDTQTVTDGHAERREVCEQTL